MQIRIKRGGKVVHSESETFDREPAARIWMDKREQALAAPGGLEKVLAKDPLLHEVIAQYELETKRDVGRTKKQVLKTIRESSLGKLRCSEATSQALVAWAQQLGQEREPQTVQNYVSHLASVFAIAKPAWGYPLDQQAMTDARAVMVKMALTARSATRDRRPTLDELDQLLEHFTRQRRQRHEAIPMAALLVFCLFSTRRIDEACRIQWKDLDEKRSEVWVRDMKHPGEKIGNDVLVTLPPEALQVVLAQPRTAGRIFPYSSKSASTAFTRAAAFLGIEDLHMHDLRHEGVSRLFELGWTIPQAATVSGHRT
ncbi:MAG TPA: tyrosine-type recombinase/integrase, partial [Ramlibacter sp.]